MKVFWHIQKRTHLQKAILGLVICAFLIIPLLPIGISGPNVAHAQASLLSQFLAAKFTPHILTATLKLTVIPALQGISTLALTISSLYLGISGILLDYAVDLTVVHMGTLLNNMDSLRLAWQLFRDAVNMIFIFIVLFIAISIILQVERFGQRKLLVSIIIAALLINFSMFFTRVIVDTSNVLTYQFYKPVRQLSGIAAATGDDPTKPSGVIGFAAAFMDLMHLQTLYKELSDPGKILQPLEMDFRIITYQLLGSVFFVITAFVFTTAALFFVLRFVTIVLLLVSSPLAFIGMILPKGENISTRWWGYLWDTFWSVYYMILISISYLILSDGTFIQHTRLGKNQSFIAAFSNKEPGSMLIVLNFTIVIGFLIAALVIAKSSSANISRGFTNFATRTAGRLTSGTLGWAGRQTFGRLGRRMADSSTLNKMASSRNLPLRLLGSGLVRTGDTFQKGSFDARAGISSTGVDLGKAKKGGRKKAEDARTKRKQGYMDKAKTAVSAETRRLISKSEKELADAKSRQAQLTPIIQKYADEEKAIWDNPNLSHAGKVAATMKLRLQRKQAGKPETVGPERVEYQKATRDAEAAQKRLDAAREHVRATTGEEKEEARRELSLAARNVNPQEAAELRDRLGKTKLAKEAAIEKQRAISEDVTRSAEERQVAQGKAGELENELKELNKGIDQLGDQQKKYLNTYVRYERAEMRQSAAHKQNAQLIVEQNLGSVNPTTRAAAENVRKELNKGSNERALEKILKAKEKEKTGAEEKEDGDKKK